MSGENITPSLPPCCAKFYNEKEMMKKALHKEREKRQLLEHSYKELLRNYNNLLDLKSVLDSSSTSFSPSEHLITQKVQSTSQSDNRGVASSSDNAFLTQPNNQNISKQQSVYFTKQKTTPILTFSSSCENRSNNYELSRPNSQVAVNNRELINEKINNEKNSIRHRKMAISVSKTMSNIRTPLNEKMTNLNIIREEVHFGKYNEDFFQQKNKSVAYFVSFTENPLSNINNKKAQICKKKFEERSKKRCQLIQEASRKRALIVSNRRAVTYDILIGKRQLDEDAKEILRKDSTSVSAFPNLLKTMRASSRRKVEEGFRRKLESERQIRLDRAVNRILSHIC